MMKRVYLQKAYLLLFCLLGLTLAGCGTKTPVTVYGTVIDKDGNPMIGAKVQIGSAVTTVPIGSTTGAFSLEARSGNTTLTVTKSGFQTYTRQLSLKAPGPVSLGEIVLTVNTPSYGGQYTDSRLLVPNFSAGKSEFDVPTPNDNGDTWIMLYPQIDTVTSYGVNITSSLNGFTSNLAVSNPKAKRSGFSISSVTGRNYSIDERMRQDEQNFARYRSQLMSQRSRMRSQQSGDSVGMVRQFTKFDFMHGETIVTISATCKAIGAHAIIYVDNSAPKDSAYINQLLDMFDNAQPRLTAAFGDEFDVDGNGKVVILLTPMPMDSGILFGYFWSGNEFPKTLVADSNETDMIYINSAVDSSLESSVRGTLAHEYQHYLHFSNRIQNGTAFDDTWLNEGFAMLAEDIVGLGYLSGDTVAVSQVETWAGDARNWSLINWNNDDQSYGGSYAFARYLYDHYGSLATLYINKSPYGGTRAVTDAVGGTFGDVFRSFAASLALSYYGRSSSDSRLGFPSGFRIPDTVKGYTLSAGSSYNFNSTVKAWGLAFLWLDGGSTGTTQHFQINASSGNFGAVVVRLP